VENRRFEIKNASRRKNHEPAAGRALVLDDQDAAVVHENRAVVHELEARKVVGPGSLPGHELAVGEIAIL
jgi:hypothetical protein